jgi:muramoyltetrapeptide carboxypeptidase
LGDFLMPPALRPGDRVRIIAPASPFDRTLYYRGIGWLAERYRVEVSEGILARNGFLAGSDGLRGRALDDALTSDVAAIVAARGGYGAMRITPQANWAALRRRPKWIVGFSDVTALHVEAQRMGLCSMHAENAAGLGRGDARARELWIDALEQPARSRSFDGLSALHGGRAEGKLAGGNLTVLFSAHAAGRLTLPAECLLLLEDVTESSYRVDRMLSALLAAGALDRVAGVVLGDFTECAPGVHRVPVEAVLAERLGTLGVPVLAGLHFGHGRHNLPLRLGSPALADANAGRLLVGERG